MDKLKNTIINMLADFFGEAKPSLSIREKRGRKDTLFFYCVEREEQILSLLDHIRNVYSIQDEFGLKGLRLDYYDTGIRTDPTKKQVVVRVNDVDDVLIIRFSTIEGVRFHQSYGKRLVATLIPGSDPLLELWINKDKMLFAKTKCGLEPLSFRWWINKCIRNNEQIRETMVAILQLLGSDHMILKDIARVIEKDHFFLPPLQFPQILSCHNPSDLMRATFSDSPQKLLKVNYNKIDINAGYYITSFADEFDKDSQEKLINYPINECLGYIRNRDLYEGPNAERFLIYHCLRGLPFAQSWEIRTEIGDYIGMCKRVGELLHLFPSFEALKKKHNELSDRIRESYLANVNNAELSPINSEYRKLAEDMSISSNGAIEWVHEANRLYREGADQHNCVYCYRQDIENDKCGIFHLDRSGEEYTIRIEKNHFGLFFIAEMRAKYNQPHRRDDFDYVQKILSRSSRSIDEYEQISLFDLREENAEIAGWDGN